MKCELQNEVTKGHADTKEGAKLDKKKWKAQISGIKQNKKEQYKAGTSTGQATIYLSSIETDLSLKGSLISG